jgi:hypothetical protein
MLFLPNKFCLEFDISYFVLFVFLLLLLFIFISFFFFYYKIIKEDAFENCITLLFAFIQIKTKINLYFIVTI